MISVHQYEYMQCSRCVMDTSSIDITFDNNGVCNYCIDFLERSKSILLNNMEQREEQLELLIKKIKKSAKHKAYDCVVGISGGVDSSWVLVKAIELGLRPLAVHMDNGWNSELAQNNIANLVERLGVDLYTYVIDWEEYRDLMQAFFDADVIDIEILYDNAMLGVNYQLARKNKIKYLLFGTNIATEGILLPKDWVWLKNDSRNIRGIAKLNNVRINTYPLFSTLDLVLHKKFYGINAESLLNYLDYNKNIAIKELENKFNYKKYPYKHYESIFTRFYQGYILPRKFNVDKRRVHFSTLIMTNQMSRETALQDLNSIPYPSLDDLETDIQYFLKKMRWSRSELDSYISRPKVSHNNYPSEIKIFESLYSIKNKLKLS